MMKHLQPLSLGVCLLAAPVGAEEGADVPVLLLREDGAPQKDKAAGGAVQLRFALRVAPGQSVRPEDVSLTVTLYNLTDNLDIVPAPHPATLEWRPTQTGWQGGEIRLVVACAAAGEASPAQRHYGYAATLRYQGEVLQRIASSEELLPQPNPSGGRQPAGDTPIQAPTEEAVPYSDFLKDNPQRDS